MRAKHTALILTAGFLLIPTLTWSQGPGGGRPGGNWGGGQWGGQPGGDQGGGRQWGQGGGRQWGGDQGGGGRGFGMTQFNGQPGMGAPGMGAPGMGGPGGGRGRMMMDPDQFFDQYSKDGRTLRKEDLPPQLQMAIQFMGPQLGLTGNEWTRDQLKAIGENMKNKVAQAGGPQAFAQGIAQGMPMGAPGMGGPPGGGFDMDRMLEQRFQQMDKNQDGVLQYDEMSETLQNERDKYDTNHDGVIDLNEFKAYVAARRGDGTNGDTRRGGNGQDAPADGEEVRKRPTIVRAGNMPADFPYAYMDRDQDGQIGLYEWKEAGQPISQFLAMDLNNDGFLTVDEYYRWKQQEAEALAKANGGSAGNQFAMGNGRSRGPGGPGGGMGMPGGGWNGFGRGNGGPGGGMGMPGGMGNGGGWNGFGRGTGGPGGGMGNGGGWNGFGRGNGGPGGGMGMPGGGMGNGGGWNGFGRGMGGPGGGMGNGGSGFTPPSGSFNPQDNGGAAPPAAGPAPSFGPGGPGGRMRGPGGGDNGGGPGGPGGRMRGGPGGGGDNADSGGGPGGPGGRRGRGGFGG